MSRNLNPRRKPERMAKAAVRGMRAPAAMVKRVAIERQANSHIPAVDCDPAEVPDL